MQRHDALKLMPGDRLIQKGHDHITYRVVANTDHGITIEREDNGERTTAPAYKFWMMTLY